MKNHDAVFLIANNPIKRKKNKPDVSLFIHRVFHSKVNRRYIFSTEFK